MSVLDAPRCDSVVFAGAEICQPLTSAKSQMNLFYSPGINLWTGNNFHWFFESDRIDEKQETGLESINFIPCVCNIFLSSHNTTELFLCVKEPDLSLCKEKKIKVQNNNKVIYDIFKPTKHHKPQQASEIS